MKILNIVEALDKYVSTRSWIGYDPYDLRAHTWIDWLLRKNITSKPTKAATILYPLFLRKLLRIPILAHPKAIGLFASSYLLLHQTTAEEHYRTKAIKLLDWLLANNSRDYGHLAWGAPFSYSGRDTLPPGTPTTVITSIAIQALLDGYQVLGDRRYLEGAKSACNFLTQDINRYKYPDDSICFSKAPGVQWYIHNSNMYVAAVLLQISQISQDSSLENLARSATRYTLSYQNEDGSWYYWGPPSSSMEWIDHYHTGFLLRALHRMYQITSWDELREPLEKGVHFYIHKMFTDKGVPKYTDRRNYPVDIHACAEAIFCLSQLAKTFPETTNVIHKVLDYTLTRMRHPSGYFYYRDYRWVLIKIPFMRWGQAWMMRGLSEYLSEVSQETSGMA